MKSQWLCLTAKWKKEEKRICELEQRTIWITQSEQKKLKKKLTALQGLTGP